MGSSLLDQLYWKGENVFALCMEDIEERRRLLVYLFGYLAKHKGSSISNALTPATSLACSLLVNKVTSDRYPGFTWDGEPLEDTSPEMLNAMLPACGAEVISDAISCHPMALQLLVELPGLREVAAKFLLLCLLCSDAREQSLALAVLLKFSKHLGRAAFYQEVAVQIRERLLNLCSCDGKPPQTKQQIISCATSALTLCYLGDGFQPEVLQVISWMLELMTCEEFDQREVVLDFNRGGFLSQEQKDSLQVGARIMKHQFSWVPQTWLLLWVPTMSPGVLSEQLAKINLEDKQRFAGFLARWAVESDATVNFCKSIMVDPDLSQLLEPVIENMEEQ